MITGDNAAHPEIKLKSSVREHKLGITFNLEPKKIREDCGFIFWVAVISARTGIDNRTTTGALALRGSSLIRHFPDGRSIRPPWRKNRVARDDWEARKRHISQLADIPQMTAEYKRTIIPFRCLLKPARPPAVLSAHRPSARRGGEPLRRRLAVRHSLQGG